MTAAPPGRAFSARAIITGVALAIGFAALAPYNDWQLRNTYLYGQHLPTGVLFLAVLTGLAINPLLGRWRFRSGELLVIAGLLLVVGGVASSGLNRTWTGVVAGPARILTVSSELDPLVERDGVQLPARLYLGVDGAPVSPPHLIDGFHDGAGGGAPPAVPWREWIGAGLRWAPLLLGAITAFLALAALVREQWVHHERLPYPIAGVFTSLLADPQPGRRVADLYRERGFRVAAIAVAAVLLLNGTAQLGLQPFAIPTELHLGGVLDLEPFNRSWAFWGLANPGIYFSIIAIVFLLPTDLSFSLWFWFVVGNLVYGLLSMQGVPVHWTHPSQVVTGAWFVECLLILWIGRAYYGRVLRAAVSRTDDPGLRSVRVFAWALLAGTVAMVLAMVASGARPHHACVAALVILGMGLVLARLVAEAGIPFVQMSIGWQVTPIIFSFTGLVAPAAALVPLTLLGQTLAADAREHLIPFAVNAERLADQAGVRRLPWTGLCLAVTGVAACVAAAVMLVCAYHGDGMGALDGYWRSSLIDQGLGPVARAASGAEQGGDGVMLRYATGAAVMAGLGAARLAWSWWPLHPLGFLVCAAYPTIVLWFSFLLGWLAKWLVMRYGGLALYRRLQPAAMGMIAGEALVVGGFLLLGLVCAMLGVRLDLPRILPG